MGWRKRFRNGGEKRLSGWMEEGFQKGEENVSKGWRKCFKRVEKKRWSGWVVESISAVFCHQLVGDVSLMSSWGMGSPPHTHCTQRVLDRACGVWSPTILDHNTGLCHSAPQDIVS